MSDIPLRELRNNTSDVLRRVEDGERFTVTVNGRPVAHLVPTQRRRRFLSWDEVFPNRADPGMRDDLAALLGSDAIDDVPIR